MQRGGNGNPDAGNARQSDARHTTEVAGRDGARVTSVPRQPP